MSVVVVLALLLNAQLGACIVRESAGANSSIPTRQLLFVAELCRHGDRTPLYEFPADAWPASKWPEGVGELTAIGMRAHYELGTRLRERYVDSGYLSSSYTPEEVYVRSTDIDRTLTSATSQLAGLYPPGTAANTDVRVRFGKDPLHENEGGLPHLFQPIPVHSEHRSTDVLLLPGNNCPMHQLTVYRKLQSPEYQEVVETNADFLEVARKLSGFKGDKFSLTELERLHDTWTCFNAHSVPLPSDVTPDVLQKAKNLSDWQLTFMNRGVDVNRMRAGLILYEVKRFMAAAVQRDLQKLPKHHGKYGKKFVLFSAHDTTVAATLAALQVFDGHYPPYNSTLIWELFKSPDGLLSIRIEYNGRALRLPGCSDEYCPVHEYVMSTKERTVEGVVQREVECLTGWRRLAAMAYHPFSRKTEDGVADFGMLDGDNNSSSQPPWLLPPLFLCVVALAGAFAAFRARSRYKGYTAAPSEQASLDDYSALSDKRSAAERRILM